MHCGHDLGDMTLDEGYETHFDHGQQLCDLDLGDMTFDQV